MIITCEKCFTKYAVPDNSIGVMGRTVKCAKCSYSWLQMPVNLEAVETRATEKLPEEPLPEKEAQPFPLETKKESLPTHNDHGVHYIFKMIPTICLMISFILSLYVYSGGYGAIFPFMKKIYAHYGIVDYSKLELADFTIERVEHGESQEIDLQGYVVNNSDQEMMLPSIKLSVYDSHGKRLGSFIKEYDNLVNEPKSKFEFSNYMTRVPKSAKKITLEIGNKIELTELEFLP